MTLLAVVPSLSSSYDDGDDDVGRCSPHHIQAQRLNNTAATCIEIGNELRGRGGKRGRGRGQQQKYEKAISILAKALRICEREEEQEHHHAYDVCSCHYCSLDGCIVSSEVDDHDHAHYHDNDNDIADFNNINEDNNDGTHIYQRPIYVYEGHNMGSALVHIIAGNLAIAHHLLAMINTENEYDSESNIEEDNDKKKKSILIHKALKFYELAYECNLAANTDCSTRFDMILCNNLSHIYRYQEQTEEQNEQQQQPITTSDDNDNENDDSIGLDIEELLEFEYYSQEEEQEEYKDNTSLISLLTTVSSTA